MWVLAGIVIVIVLAGVASAKVGQRRRRRVSQLDHFDRTIQDDHPKNHPTPGPDWGG